jgi:dTDP-4-dehydrorhamnose reductase
MRKKVLILGVTGMLGHVLFKELSRIDTYEVYGTTRSMSGLNKFFTLNELSRIRPTVDADNFDTVIRAFAALQPDIVINCIGLIKQLAMAEDPLTAITVNAQLPHRLSMLTRNANARLIHISTDCIFDGKKGNYEENDDSNAKDLYGRTKFLGEVTYPHCVTLRTSIIGHELKNNVSLVDWFLNETKAVRGFTKALYTGFSTLEMAKIISKYVIPNDEINGLYQVSSEVISKHDLIKLIAEKYNKKIDITPYEDFVLDRTLKSENFRNQTGYAPPSWDKIVEQMYEHFMTENCYADKKQQFLSKS